MLASIGSYNLKGCYTDSTAARVLTGFTVTNSTGMTEEFCVETCRERGYGLAGLEFGKECYCGNTLARSAVMVGMTDCMTLYCPGNKKEFCSAGNRLLIYSSGP